MPDNKNDSLASLTERLREARKIADEYPWGQPSSGTVKAVVGDVLEAADELERLQAENAALKARLGGERAAEHLQAVEIGEDGRAYIVGTPACSTDVEEKRGDGHNCDAMGCPSAARHTLYVLPVTADARRVIDDVMVDRGARALHFVHGRIPFCGVAAKSETYLGDIAPDCPIMPRFRATTKRILEAALGAKGV